MKKFCTRDDPEVGAGDPETPLKITSGIDFYRIKHKLPLGIKDPSGKF